jgi:hypothetical protein
VKRDAFPGLIFLVSAIFLANTPIALANSASRSAADEDNAREAVIRDLARDFSDATMTIFVSIDGKAASDQFIQRFRDFKNPVKKDPKTEGFSDENGTGHLQNKSTKEPGVILNVEKLQWISKSEIEMDGSYSCGALCGGGSTFRVVLKAGKWVAHPVGPIWAS